MIDFPIELARSIFGPVRLIKEQDMLFDLHNYNKQVLISLFALYGWNGEEILYISPKKNHGRKQLFLSMLDSLKIPYRKIEGNIFTLPWKLFFVPNKKNRFAIAGFRSHESLIFIRTILGTQSTIFFDSLVSIYDTLCGDRAIFMQNSPVGYILKKLDILLCTKADEVFVDTTQTAEYFEDEFSVKKPIVLYADCNPDLFIPKKNKEHTKLRCLWYGSNQPLHGLSKIIEFINITKDLEIHFTLIGPVDKTSINSICYEARKNVSIQQAIPLESLATEIARSDVCIAGPFGSSRKAQSVICTKTYEMLHCGKPVLVPDNLVHRSVFGETI